MTDPPIDDVLRRYLSHSGDTGKYLSSHRLCRDASVPVGVASTAAIAVVNGTDRASAIPPTAERAISIATLSLVSTSASDRLATLNSRSSGSELPA